MCRQENSCYFFRLVPKVEVVFIGLGEWCRYWFPPTRITISRQEIGNDLSTIQSWCKWRGKQSWVKMYLTQQTGQLYVKLYDFSEDYCITQSWIYKALLTVVKVSIISLETWYDIWGFTSSAAIASLFCFKERSICIYTFESELLSFKEWCLGISGVWLCSGRLSVKEGFAWVWNPPCQNNVVARAHVHNTQMAWQRDDLQRWIFLLLRDGLCDIVP